MKPIGLWASEAPQFILRRMDALCFGVVTAFKMGKCSWRLYLIKFPLGVTVCNYFCWHFPQFSSVQSLSHVRFFVTPWIAAHHASLSITNSWSLLKLMPIELVMPSSHLILCHPLLLLPPIPSSIRVFSNESTLCIRWPKYNWNGRRVCERGCNSLRSVAFSSSLLVWDDNGSKTLMCNIWK